MPKIYIPRLNVFNHLCRRNLSLAYTKHRVAQSSTEEKNYAPLIVLHGLFGSRQNNRSISKYDITIFPRRGLILMAVGSLLETWDDRCMP